MLRILISTLIFVFFLSPLNAQKKILIEKFTNFACGHCPDGTLLLEDIARANQDVIWVLHHKPVDWIDNELTNEQSRVLWDDLKAPGNPTAMFNRAPFGLRLTTAMSQWKTELAKQKDTPYYAQVAVSGVDFDHGNRMLSFDLNIVFDELPPTIRFAISALIIEDRVQSIHQHSYFNNVAGHPLEGRGEQIEDYEHRNVVRTILDAPWGTNQAIPPSPVVGETYTMSYSYEVPETYNLNNMKIVGFLTKQNNDDVLDRAVYNTTEVELSAFGISSSKEINDLHAVTLSPNPVDDRLSILFDEVPDQVKVLSQDGNLIGTYSPSAKNLSIDVSSYDPGLYLVQLQYGNQQVVEKFTIVR